MATQPRIEVLMTSYNHAPYVGQQVESILGQTYGNWDLTISDDGSTDGSLDILHSIEARYHDRVRVVMGPGKGIPYNHLSLVANADPGADWYAWCDSDDVWVPDRLEHIVEVVGRYGQGRPVLYGNRLALMDPEGRGAGLYPLMDRLPPRFGNSFVQVVTPGATMVFNRPARELIALGCGHDMPPSQDSWAYMIVSGAGGRVIYDPYPSVRYRQHGGNALGANGGLRAKLARIGAVLGGSFRESLGRELDALVANEGWLTPENRGRLAAMMSLHLGKGGPLHRLRLAYRAGLCRQSWPQSAFIFVMAAIGRL